MTTHEQIEKLRADIAAIEAAKKLFEKNKMTWFVLKAEKAINDKKAAIKRYLAENYKLKSGAE